MREIRSFLVLWTGQAMSLLATQAVQFALVWWLTAQTGSAGVLAGATFVALAPPIFLGPFIGAWIDRWNRKRILWVSDALAALVSGMVGLAFLFDAVSPGLVLASIAVRAVCGAFHGPTMLASTTLMVPAEYLTRIQGLNQALQGGALIVSAPLGALLMAALPMPLVMAVDLVTAAVAIAPLAFVAVPQPPARPDAAAPGWRSTWSDVLEAVVYLRERRGHVAIVTMALMINLFLVPAFALLPLLVVEQGGGAGSLGAMQSAVGIGTIAGGVLLAAWGGFSSRLNTSFAGLVALGLATLAVGGASSIAVAIAGIVAVGLAAPFVNGPIQAVLQATVAPEVQGRVFALYASASGAIAPVGLAIAAPVAEWAGVRSWFAAAGVICVAMGVVGFFVPSIRALQERPDAQSSAASA